MSQPADLAVVQPALLRMGLIDADETPSLQPLSGGVSSLIVRVDTRRGPLCVKQALPELKVATHWSAPLSRNLAEVAWMREVSRLLPQAVPQILGEDPSSYTFAMQWLAPERHPVWKSLLRDGVVEPAFAAQVAALVARIHASTAHRPELAAAFANDRNFNELRLDPYFVAAARAHPDCAPALLALVERTATTKLALVHGDISPKNILAGPAGPVILDAECAWYGDPAFDAAFCLTHLLAKCLWRPASADAFLACFDAFAESYLAGADWEPRAVLEARIAQLLAGILLARVDGKSPLEYLDDEGRAAQRAFARRFVLAPSATLAAMRAAWKEDICQ